MQYCFSQHWTLLPTPVTSTTGCGLCFGSASLFFMELLVDTFPVAYRSPTNLESSSFNVISFCLFILSMGLTRQECLSGLPLPSPGEHIVSKLSTMTHQSWVSLHDMAHSFTDKALINLTKLWTNCSVLLFFCNCGFYSVFPGSSALAVMDHVEVWPKGATPCPRSGVEGEELPRAWGQGQQPRLPGGDGAGAAEKSYPTPEAKVGGQEEQLHVQGAVAARTQEGWEKLIHVQGQEGQHEEIPLIQCKEQWPCFAGAAVKRHPTYKVRETKVRW